MKKQIPLWPVIALAILLAAGVGYMVLVRPKQSQAAALEEQIAELDAKVTAARLASRPQKAATSIKVADIFQVTKAMPDSSDMPGIILDLNSVADATGIAFLSIQPGGPAAKTGYAAIPITLTFEGNYYDLTDFLFRLRNLVTVRHGRLAASGRLFTLDSLNLHEGKAGFPQITADLTVSAYVYGAPTVPGAPAPTGTTPATTTPAAASSGLGGLG
ncbi:MAG: type 4a pilus biogenesis protein PilO [Gaiellaceae bacterium]